MYVVEITAPGQWIDSQDRAWSFEVTNLLTAMQSEFFDANNSCNLFEEQMARISSVATTIEARMEEHRERLARSKVLEEQVEADLGIKRDSAESSRRIEWEIECRLKREQWATGTPPQEFQRGLVRLYARAFIQAADMFEKYLGVLTTMNDAPAALAPLRLRFEAHFSDLRPVRNTIQHMEDRLRGLGAGRNPRPLPNGQRLMLGNFHGNRYGTTLSDGQYGYVEISRASVDVMADVLQETLNSYRWLGTAHHLPT